MNAWQMDAAAIMASPEFQRAKAEYLAAIPPARAEMDTGRLSKATMDRLDALYRAMRHYTSNRRVWGIIEKAILAECQAIDEGPGGEVQGT